MSDRSNFDVRTGEVFLEHFDHGVATTLGGIVNAAGDMYVVKSIPGIEAPPDFEGVPVYFGFSDEVYDRKILPSFVIRRDAVTPALSRLHMGVLEYKVPAPGAHFLTVTNPRTGDIIKTGWDQYEIKGQAVPYDLLYTIQIRARFRNNLSVDGMRLLKYTMRIYQPYSRVILRDSLGEIRTYDAFMETPTPVDSKQTVADRETNWNLTLRVEAELDINDPELRKTLTSLPDVRYGLR